MNKTRLETICDGIFAIVMTLLILDVRFPENTLQSENFSLLENLILIKSKILAFAFSFFIISSYVIGNHFILSLTKKIDGVFLTLTFFYLMIITFIPFPTSILSEHPESYESLVFYSINVMLAGIFNSAMLWYIYKNDHLRNDKINKITAKNYFKRNVWGTSAVFTAIGIGYFSIPIGLFILILIPIYFSVTRILIEKRNLSDSNT
jgi:uncharacterized membrane protein